MNPPNSENAPPPRPGELKRQRWIIKVAMVLLVVMAVLLVTIVPRVPLALRVFIALFDLGLAALLWLVLKQKFGGMT